MGSRDGNHRNFDVTLTKEFGHLGGTTHFQFTRSSADFGWIIVKDGNNVETPLQEAAVVRDSPTKITRADHDHRPFAIDLQNLLELCLEMADLVASTLFAELAK